MCQISWSKRYLFSPSCEILAEEMFRSRRERYRLRVQPFGMKIIVIKIIVMNLIVMKIRAVVCIFSALHSNLEKPLLADTHVKEVMAAIRSLQLAGDVRGVPAKRRIRCYIAAPITGSPQKL